MCAQVTEEEGSAPPMVSSSIASGSGGSEIQNSGSRKIQQHKDVVAALKACGASKNLSRGRALHAGVVESGDFSNMYIANTLLSMYAKCGSMADARRVFDAMPSKNVVSWTSLMLGYADNGQEDLALDLFICMQQLEPGGEQQQELDSTVEFDRRARREVEVDKKMEQHLELNGDGKSRSISEASSKKPWRSKAETKDPQQQQLDWTIKVDGNARDGKNKRQQAKVDKKNQRQQDSKLKVDSKDELQQQDSKATVDEKNEEQEDSKTGGDIKIPQDQDANTKVDCPGATKNKSQEQQRKADRKDQQQQQQQEYSKTKIHRNTEANDVRGRNHQTNTERHQLSKAEVDRQHPAIDRKDVQQQRCLPDGRTFVAALKACSSLATKEPGHHQGSVLKPKSLKLGAEIHRQASNQNCIDTDIFVANALVDMYVKCGSLEDARRVLDSMPRRDVVSWTTLMLGYVETAPLQALELYSRMIREKCRPNARTFVAALKACAALAADEQNQVLDNKMVKVRSLVKGMAFHAQAATTGCDTSDLFVASTLVDMYAKSGAMGEARRVFDKTAMRDTVSWNALMLGYADNGDPELALKIFSHMRPEGCEPTALSFVTALKACAAQAGCEEARPLGGELVKALSLEKGMALESHARKKPLLENSHHLCNSLVDMYAKCGSLLDAQRVFDTIPQKSIVSWNALILAYAENGQPDQALDLFSQMLDAAKPPPPPKDQTSQSTPSPPQHYQSIPSPPADQTSPTPDDRTLRHASPDEATFVAALKACGSKASLDATKKIHARVCQYGRSNEPAVVTCLLDAYGKSGSMASAELVFDSAAPAAAKNPVNWTALLTGYCSQGDSFRVFRLFRMMVDEGVGVDRITLLCVLTACSQNGLVEKARTYIDSMSSEFGVAPGVDHYLCLVDALARANKLDEAVSTIKSMPHEPNWIAWMTVLSACWKWKNVAVAEEAFEALLELDEEASAPYMLMANIYGSSGMLDEQSKVETMKNKKRKKRARTLPGVSSRARVYSSGWTDQAGMVHSFVAQDSIFACDVDRDFPEHRKVARKISARETNGGLSTVVTLLYNDGCRRTSCLCYCVSKVAPVLACEIRFA